MSNDEAVKFWYHLAHRGATVSVCLGPSGPTKEIRWSVTAMSADGELAQPFAAHDLGHAIEIAIVELDNLKRAL